MHGAFRPTVIDKGWPIEDQGSVTIRVLLIMMFAHGPTRRTSPGEGIDPETHSLPRRIEYSLP